MEGLGVAAYCLPLRFWQDGTVALMKKYKAISKDVLDYPSTMSMYEKESLAAEATLRVEKPTAKKRKPKLRGGLKIRRRMSS
jgi:TfoX/Sxy family transcriptional regulator of competence genes